MASQMMMANALQGGGTPAGFAGGIPAGAFGLPQQQPVGPMGSGGAGVMPNPTETADQYQVGEQGYFSPMQQYSLGNYGQPQELGEGIVPDLEAAMATPEPVAPAPPPPAPAYTPPAATANETRPAPPMVTEGNTPEISPEWNEWMVEQVATGNPMTSYNPEVASIDPRLAEQMYNEKQQQRGSIEDSWGQETQAVARDAMASVTPAEIPEGLNQAQVARNRLEGFPDEFSLADYIAANPGVNERTVFDHARANQGAAAPAATPAAAAPAAKAPTRINQAMIDQIRKGNKFSNFNPEAFM